MEHSFTIVKLFARINGIDIILPSTRIHMYADWINQIVAMYRKKRFPRFLYWHLI